MELFLSLTAAASLVSVFLRFAIAEDKNYIPSPVKCHGPVPKITEGEYYFHDNDTYQLKMATTISLQLDLQHRSCFQVDFEISNPDNDTQRVTSLFYAVGYDNYLHHYNVRTSYQFGIPEFQSYCKCDCPKADDFCKVDYGDQDCAKGEICITKFYDNQVSTGCQHEGMSTICCELAVKPFENRRFTAINLGQPTPEVEVSVEIYALYRRNWSLFRRYLRNVLPYKGNNLHLNGHENVADMYIFAQAAPSQYSLSTAQDDYYFYEDKAPANGIFQLRESPQINNVFDHDPNKLGWLRYNNGKWIVQDKFEILDLHKPVVINCKDQTYYDRFKSSNTNVLVIRNSTGHITSQPLLGTDVLETQKFIQRLWLGAYSPGHANSRVITLSHSPSRAPSLKLDMALHQKITVIAHLHASYMDSFLAKLCLDKQSNRFLNITLVQAIGEFLVEVYQDADDEIDLVLSIVTNLPFASNYTENLPLPGHIASSRYICVHPMKQPTKRMCQLIVFERQPIEWFELKATYIENEGTCPGCNKETATSFWDHLNPKNWFNGIQSLSEGVALAVEIAVYVILAVIAIAIFRKLVWPFLKWALCSNHKGRRNHAKYEKCSMKSEKASPQFEPVYKAV